MHRGALLIALLGACGADPDGAGDPGSCAFERLLADMVDGGASRDCGSFTLGDRAAYRSGHDCVAAAVAAAQPFHVAWYAQGIDSIVRFGYVAHGGAGGLEILRLGWDSDPSGGAGIGATAYRTRCGMFVDQAACESVDTGLCFDCRPVGPSEALCN